MEQAQGLRFKWTEMTPYRIAEAALRRARDVPHRAAWHLPEGIENRIKLERFRSKHKGQRCIVIANGPSLATMDLSPLKNEITIGLNRCYLMFDKWGFEPTYFVSINGLVLEQFASDIRQLSMPLFLNWNRRALFQPSRADTLFLRMRLTVADEFTGELTRPICDGGTVTYAALQLAYYLGCTEVVLVGLDHSFVEKGRPNKTEVRHYEVDASHCHPDYFPKGVKWQLPDLQRSEIAYATARRAFEQAGRRIVDATPGGKCPVFERAEFGELFR
ncbi:MAG: 6-hydroxymethylpterin diphosphokinase MptE-like protein [Pseudomonadota bacterium]